MGLFKANEFNNVMSIVESIGRYGLVGVINTLVHWCFFFALYSLFAISQAYSNLLAFLVAVTTSFFLNAYFTFKTYTNLTRYVLFVSFMGLISFFIGTVGDRGSLSPWVTLIVFSVVSFLVGFMWSKFFVFRS